jgi:hypothetical protein
MAMQGLRNLLVGVTFIAAGSVPDILSGPAAAQEPVTSPTARRLQWQFPGGVVRNEYGGRWLWTQGREKTPLTENLRTDTAIELTDKTHGYTLRLTATELLIRGGNDKAPKQYPDFTKLHSGKWTAEFPVIAVGKLSEKYESGGRGPATVSTGKGDPGGVSYGTYQLASKVGRADQFVKKYYPKEFEGLQGGTPEFSERWKKLAQSDPDALHGKEHEFIKATHYDPQAAKILKETKLDVGTRSRVFQDVVWSTSVQHGPNTPIIVLAVQPLFGDRGPDGVSEEAMIRAIYAERGRKNAQGTLVYFTRASEAVQKAVANRFVQEMKDALEALRK